MNHKAIKIGMVGFGTVGRGVWEILEDQASLLARRIGAPVEISKIAVRSDSKKRGGAPGKLFTTDIGDILGDPDIAMVVEVMGGVEEAKSLAMATIMAGKHLITANKALLALHGREVFAAAKAAGVDVCFEAAVGGGIPILRALREGYVANRITSLYGIVNGTCNFILSEMAEKGASFQSTLARAQELGYAEADPKFDIDGWDAAHKLAILISIAHGVHVPLQKLYVEGIRRLTPYDLECAKRFGFEIKLLAIAKLSGAKIQGRVHPTMVPAGSMLAAVRGVHNAIAIDGDSVGEGMLYGRGAGSRPTASAVVGDIVEVARNLVQGIAYTVPPLGLYADKIQDAAIEPIDALRGPYYLRFQALDRPGVLAKITAILGSHRIGISSVYQNVREEGRAVPIVILTHEALERDIQRAIAKIDRLEVIKDKTVLIRVEEKAR